MQATSLTKTRYDRIAPVYDLIDFCCEWVAFKRWRKRVWDQAEGIKILEVGVGTGKNMPYYPKKAQIIGIDISDKMLTRARKRAVRLGTEVTLLPMDAQALEFSEASFDCVVATFVFCSVPDPVLGLQEVRRVCRPGGRIILLEHMRPENELFGRLADLFNPIFVRLWGANLNRRTLENVHQAGLEIERVETLVPSGLVKLIVARPIMRSS
ncbi:methyltransferase domain-containing protein [Candidatus Acetothermia bacterium]|nr:methyltransferase domain-containing protein [Candidatus Acetothermia bacterium]